MNLETELLLRCVRSRSSPENTQRVRDLLDGFAGWDSLLARAERQGVLPALAWTLDSRHPLLVPAPLRERVLRVLATAVASHERMWAALREILDAFAEQGIETMALKGPPFALRCFANPAARMCRDLDLIVARDRLAAAGKALAVLGFAPHLHGERHGRPAQHRKHADPLLFLRQADRLPVDLHTELGRPRLGAIPVDDAFWGRCRTVELDGHAVRALRANDMLLYLCSHGVQHGWRGLRFVADVHEHVEGSPDMDWDALPAQARRERRSRMLHEGLLLTHRLLETPVPAPCLARAAEDRRAVALERQASRHVLDAIRAGSIVPLGRLAEFKAIEGPAHRVTWLWHLVKDALTPCDLDEAVVRLPRPLAPLYYVVRLIRLSAKYLWGKRGT